MLGTRRHRNDKKTASSESGSTSVDIDRETGNSTPRGGPAVIAEYWGLHCRKVLGSAKRKSRIARYCHIILGAVKMLCALTLCRPRRMVVVNHCMLIVVQCQVLMLLMETVKVDG